MATDEEQEIIAIGAQLAHRFAVEIVRSRRPPTAAKRPREELACRDLASIKEAEPSSTSEKTDSSGESSSSESTGDELVNRLLMKQQRNKG